MPAAEVTLGAALRAAATRLRAAGIEAPERDARLLLAAATGAPEILSITEPQRPVTAQQLAGLDAMISRRIAREPVSRILCLRGFYGRDFEVGPATLDPRPDTETLIEVALAAVDSEGWRKRPIRILDVGTGTGALLVTLLAELPLATGLGTDLDPAALEVAARNAATQNVASRAQWRVARSLAGVAGTFDILVSNPPYIPTSDIAGLDPEVRCFDPRLALDGGADGLDVYREILSEVSRVVPDGWIILEVGTGQAGAVAALMRERCSDHPVDIAVHRDLGGHQRCVAARAHPR